MSDPTLSDNNFKNEMDRVWTTLKKFWSFLVTFRDFWYDYGTLEHFRSLPLVRNVNIFCLEEQVSAFQENLPLA